MNKCVVMGVNRTPKYLYYIPLVTWAWKYFGWDTKVMYATSTEVRVLDTLEQFVFKYHKAEAVDIPSDKTSDTIAQVCRLFAFATFHEPTYILTTDADMLPLDNIWEPVDNNITCYGRDLTDYHYPMCYIGMGDVLWERIMKAKGEYIDEMIKNELKNRKIKWTTDQDIVTEKLLAHKDEIFHVDRGTDRRTGYPLGRVDRSNWRLDHSRLIDAHLPHDVLTNEDSFHKVLKLLHHRWPKEDWKWWVDYHKNFKKLI